MKIKETKKLLTLAVLGMLATPQIAGAEGFAIVEWSAEGVGMGGARMFAENDASMVAHNPASITKIEKNAFSAGGIYISPHGKYTADRKAGGIETGHNRVSPAVVPYAYYVQRVSEKDWVGIGSFVRFGMVSEFEPTSIAATNAYKSKLTGMSITPVYARKFDDKVSASVGAEINYVGLELYKKLGSPNGPNVEVKGDTWALGWNAAVNYAFDKKNEVGLVYRSKISQNMKGADFIIGGGKNYGASGKVVLPDSYSIGYGHKFNDRTRVELQGLYTRWSVYDSLNLETGMGRQSDTKNWSNGWRYAIGLEHKLSDKYTALAGYAYDGSVIPKEHSDFMIPTGSRQTFSVGSQYHDEKQKLTFVLGYMKIGSMNISPKSGDTFTKVGTYKNHAPVIAIGYQRYF